MTQRRPALKLILSAAGPAVALLVIAVFAGYALLGANGVLARASYKRQIAERSTELAQLKVHQARLLNRKALLARGDPDLADELTREATDMIGDNEYVIVTR